MPNFKTLGWVSLGTSAYNPALGGGYFCIVVHQDNTGFAIMQITNANNLAIAFFDAINFKWHNQLFLALNAYPSIVRNSNPITGNIFGAQSANPKYVFTNMGQPSNGMLSCYVPWATNANNALSAINPGPYLSGSLFTSYTSGGADSITGGDFIVSPQSGKIIIPAQISASGDFDYVEYDPFSGTCGNAFNGLRYESNSTFWYGGVGQWTQYAPWNYLHNITLGGMYDRQNFFINKQSPIIDGPGTVFFTTNGQNPYHVIIDEGANKYLYSLPNTAPALDNFDNNILSYANNPGLSGTMVGDKFITGSPGGNMCEGIYFDRANKRVYPFALPMPYNYRPIDFINVAGNCFIINEQTSEVWMLAFEIEDIEAFDVINMSRLRSE